MSPNSSRDQESLENWLVDRLASSVGIDKKKVALNASFEQYGLDSAKAVEITGDLSEWLGISVSPELFYDYPTIEKSVSYLLKELEK